MQEYEAREKKPLTPEERAAKKKKERWVAETNMAEKKKADAAFRSNYERLKVKRLAREAAKFE
jgi:hypothetical protein